MSKVLESHTNQGKNLDTLRIQRAKNSENFPRFCV